MNNRRKFAMENIKENSKLVNAYELEKYLEQENPEIEPDMVKNIKNAMEENK
jgi:hypothetical protein